MVALQRLPTILNLLPERLPQFGRRDYLVNWEEGQPSTTHLFTESINYRLRY